ncbi:hypothetical protein AVEN_158312-1 [Araneus ventricosus]|uniref:Uncharacterized protein n=1 Tax=Araneus ventricosus TaxID=182803 RepID=A0A4Y2GQ34_ARAVE|nr:hypothetical protein AVEN_158312-1 [Araneus ventricosus]
MWTEELCPKTITAACLTTQMSRRETLGCADTRSRKRTASNELYSKNTTRVLTETEKWLNAGNSKFSRLAAMIPNRGRHT